MNFILICLHSLDMRDFHSNRRRTPFLDSLKKKTLYTPMGRAQAHHQSDSLFSEITGKWTSRYTNSTLTDRGLILGNKFHCPKTLSEIFKSLDYKVYNDVAQRIDPSVISGTSGTAAAHCDIGMAATWMSGGDKQRIKYQRPSFPERIDLVDIPSRVVQFFPPTGMNRQDILSELNIADNFFAHFVIRATHRPWGNRNILNSLAGLDPQWDEFSDDEIPPTTLGNNDNRPPNWLMDILCARHLALTKPDEFSALRRHGLHLADQEVAAIFKATRKIKDVVYLIYSNHGELFDHFRHVHKFHTKEGWMIEGTSHGPFPFEILYANMQMWVIPGWEPNLISGIARSIDIPPTIIDLAKIKGYTFDGESALPHFLNGFFPNRIRYAETAFNNTGCLSMVRSDGYKIVSTGLLPENIEPHIHFQKAKDLFDAHRLAVFHLPSDPFEYVNIINTKNGQEALDWAIHQHASLKIVKQH